MCQQKPVFLLWHITHFQQFLFSKQVRVFAHLSQRPNRLYCLFLKSVWVQKGQPSLSTERDFFFIESDFFLWQKAANCETGYLEHLKTIREDASQVFCKVLVSNRHELFKNTH